MGSEGQISLNFFESVEICDGATSTAHSSLKLALLLQITFALEICREQVEFLSKGEVSALSRDYEWLQIIKMTKLQKGLLTKQEKSMHHFDCTLRQSDKVSFSVQLATKYQEMMTHSQTVIIVSLGLVQTI